MKKIKLTQGKWALVDDGDYEYLNRFKWHVHNSRNKLYAMRSDWENKAVTNTLMHREIISIPNGMEVDHIDGDGLNNQRHNIRTCAHSENSFNRRKCIGKTSEYKGVYKCGGKRIKRFLAGIKVDNKRTLLGYFFNDIDAAIAYDVAAKKYHGEFARLNFPSI